MGASVLEVHEGKQSKVGWGQNGDKSTGSRRVELDSEKTGRCRATFAKIYRLDVGWAQEQICKKSEARRVNRWTTLG